MMKSGHITANNSNISSIFKKGNEIGPERLDVMSLFTGSRLCVTWMAHYSLNDVEIRHAVIHTYIQWLQITDCTADLWESAEDS